PPSAQFMCKRSDYDQPVALYNVVISLENVKLHFPRPSKLCSFTHIRSPWNLGSASMPMSPTRSWRDYDRSAGYRHIEVLPENGAVLAEIRGVDLTQPIPDEVRKEILRAFAENLVIYIRGQQAMTREQHIAFAGLFGPLQRIPHIFSVEGYPDVQIVERTPDDSRRVVGEGFHNDSTFMPTPPTAVVMRAVDVPEFGGDTAFANLYLA